MNKKLEIIKQKKFVDERGFLVKVLLNSQIRDNKTFGEIYFISANKCCIRGDHYHKLTTEWFYVLEGEVSLLLQDEKTKEKQAIMLTENEPCIVKVPPYISHAFKINKKSKILAYSDKEYDPDHDDTYKASLGSDF